MAQPVEPSPRAVVSELQGGGSALWAVEAAEPRRRELLTTVEHAEGWGLKAAVSPNGRWLAYLVLPVAGSQADRDAELWTLDLPPGAARRLSGGLDLMGAPVWAPDGSMVAVRRTSVRDRQRDFELVGFAPEGDGAPRVLATASGVDWAGAVGWWNGRFAYATIDGSGSYLHHEGGARVRLTAGMARDFRLDSAGARLSFNVIAAGPGAALAGAVDLRTGSLGMLPAGGPATPGGWLAGSGVRGEVLAPSSDGGWEVAQVLAGHGGRGAFLASVETATGTVRPLPFRGHAEFVGWLP